MKGKTKKIKIQYKNINYKKNNNIQKNHPLIENHSTDEKL